MTIFRRMYMAYYYPSSFYEMYTWTEQRVWVFLWDRDGFTNDEKLQWVISLSVYTLYTHICGCTAALCMYRSHCLGVRLLPFPFYINDYCNFHSRIFSRYAGVVGTKISLYLFVRYVHSSATTVRWRLLFHHCSA